MLHLPLYNPVKPAVRLVPTPTPAERRASVNNNARWRDGMLLGIGRAVKDLQEPELVGRSR